MGLPAPEVRERVYEAAGFVGLGESLLEKSPFELSGGQKRRAAIAGVIAMRPEVLILDEPTAGLDPRGRDEIIGNIMNYKRAHNATVIMVTHNMEEISRTVDRIILFDNGSVAMEGTPAQVFSKNEALVSLGLTAPKVTLVAARLRALGLSLRRDIYTIAQLRQALCEMKGESGIRNSEPGEFGIRNSEFGIKRTWNDAGSDSESEIGKTGNDAGFAGPSSQFPVEDDGGGDHA